MTTYFLKIRQNGQILKSRVSVSNFKSRVWVLVLEFLMKSRSHLEILTRSWSRRLRSRLHHWILRLPYWDLHRSHMSSIVK